jgi:hypothetical protein
MKFVPLLLATLVVIVLFGCGGSGGGGSTTATTSSSTTTGDTLMTTVIAESGPGVQVDPTNLQVGDQCTFKLAIIDLTKGTYTTTSNSGFTTTDLTGSAGTLTAKSGAFLAQHSTNGKTFTISTSSLGKTYTAQYGVTPVQARVSGMLTDSNGLPVQFGVVLFFDGSANQVGMTTATVTGAFNGSVPVSGTRFNLQPASLNSSHYYLYFTYGAGSYAPLIPTCSAPLPALSNGVVSPLSGPVTVADVSDANGTQNTPPPPPTCSP